MDFASVNTSVAKFCKDCTDQARDVVDKAVIQPALSALNEAFVPAHTDMAATGGAEGLMGTETRERLFEVMSALDKDSIFGVKAWDKATRLGKQLTAAQNAHDQEGVQEIITQMDRLIGMVNKTLS